VRRRRAQQQRHVRGLPLAIPARARGEQRARVRADGLFAHEPPRLVDLAYGAALGHGPPLPPTQRVHPEDEAAARSLAHAMQLEPASHREASLGEADAARGVRREGAAAGGRRIRGVAHHVLERAAHPNQ
jgi:hypothetical protein